MAKDNKLNTLIQSLHQTIKKEKKVAIFGPLELKDHLKLQIEAKIYVDGGVVHSKIRDSISIGDGDSARKKMLIQYPKEKDKSDLSLALKMIKHKNITIYLRGFLPLRNIESRYDHLLANFGEAYFHSKLNQNCIDFHQNIRIYPAGKHILLFTGKFSIINFERTHMMIVGKIHYPINQKRICLPFQSDLISNYAKGKFTVTSNRPFLLIRY